jgi:hypothetical protein
MDYTPHFGLWDVIGDSPWWLKIFYIIGAIRLVMYFIGGTGKITRSVKPPKPAGTNPLATSAHASAKVGGGSPVTQVAQLGHFCMECGREFPTDAKFCPHCGAKVTKA